MCVMGSAGEARARAYRNSKPEPSITYLDVKGKQTGTLLLQANPSPSSQAHNKYRRPFFKCRKLTEYGSIERRSQPGMPTHEI